MKQTAVRIRVNDDNRVHRVSMGLQTSGIWGLACEDDQGEAWWSTQNLVVVDEPVDCLACIAARALPVTS